MLRHQLPLLLVASLGIGAGCSSSTSDDAEGGGGAGAADGTGGAPLTEDGDPGLLGCDLPLTCPAFWSHVGHEPFWAPRCVAEVAISGEPGIVSHTVAPGPYDCAYQSIYIFLGNGTAVRQSRGKPNCQSPGPHFFGDATAPELCDVVVPVELEGACEDAPQMTTAVSGGPWPAGCEATPSELVANCQPIEPMTCAEALALLPAE